MYLHKRLRPEHDAKCYFIFLHSLLFYFVPYQTKYLHTKNLSLKLTRNHDHHIHFTLQSDLTIIIFLGVGEKPYVLASPQFSVVASDI